jgi:hypothetical protein
MTKCSTVAFMYHWKFNDFFSFCRSHRKLKTRKQLLRQKNITSTPGLEKTSHFTSKENGMCKIVKSVMFTTSFQNYMGDNE